MSQLDTFVSPTMNSVNAVDIFNEIEQQILNIVTDWEGERFIAWIDAFENQGLSGSEADSSPGVMRANHIAEGAEKALAAVRILRAKKGV